MDPRHHRAVSVSALLGLLVGLGCADSPARQGDAVQLETVLDGSPPDTRVHLLWLLRPRDCLQCQRVRGQLRDLEYRSGLNVPLTVLALGHDSMVVRDFLTEGRLHADVTYLSPDRAATRIPRLAQLGTPTLLILEGDTIRRIYDLEGSARVDSLEPALRTLLARETPP